MLVALRTAQKLVIRGNSGQEQTHQEYDRLGGQYVDASAKESGSVNVAVTSECQHKRAARRGGGRTHS